MCSGPTNQPAIVNQSPRGRKELISCDKTFRRKAVFYEVDAFDVERNIRYLPPSSEAGEKLVPRIL